MRFAALRFPRSLAAQLMLASAGTLLTVLALIVAAALVGLAWQPIFLVQHRLAEHVDEVEEDLQFDPTGRPVAVALSVKLEAMYDGLPKDTAFRILNRSGAVLLTSEPGPALQALQRQDFQWRDHLSVTQTQQGNTLHVRTKPIQHDGDVYFIQVAQSDRLLSLARASGGEIVLKAVIVSSVLATLVFGGAILLTVRRMVQPIRHASATAAGIDPRNLQARLDPLKLHSELTPLITAFNQALARLEHGYKVQQEFLASAAHELKTPLALMRASIEMGHAEDRQLLLKDVDFMARQVHQLLHLAEVSEVQNFRFAQIDVNAVTADATGHLQRLAERGGVKLVLQTQAEPVPQWADSGAVFILVKNLTENAILHSNIGGVVSVAVDTAGLTVTDAGHGIDAEERSRLFERFWRSPRARHEGAGLGLSICHEIVLAHGWILTAHDAEPGPGARFAVAFSSATL